MACIRLRLPGPPRTSGSIAGCASDRTQDVFDVSRHSGPTASIDNAINWPQPLARPRPRLIVGGNGRDVTWRLAARLADELNLDNVPPEEIAETRRMIAERSAEIDRDPATLVVSVHIWWEPLSGVDPASMIEDYRLAGVDRIMTLVRDAAHEVDSLRRFRDRAVEAGASMAGVSGG